MLNRLIQVAKSGKIVAEYTYDETGLRIASKDVDKNNTTYFAYDLADRAIYEKNSNDGSEISYIFANGQLFAKVEGSIGSGKRILYYHNDRQGSPRALTDETGNIVWSQEYKPFGEANCYLAQ